MVKVLQNMLWINFCQLEILAPTAFWIWFHDFTKENAKALATTTRQGDTVGTRQEILTDVGTALQNAIDNNGWFRDFTHWHTIEQDNELDEFFETLRNTISNQDVISLDFGTALQHRFIKDITTVSMNELVDYIEVNVVYDNTLTNYELNNFIINTSIEIDLTGSVLSGKDISCDYDIIKKNTDLFIIEVPYNRLNETITFNIVETTSPTYLQIKKTTNVRFYLRK